MVAWLKRERKKERNVMAVYIRVSLKGRLKDV